MAYNINSSLRIIPTICNFFIANPSVQMLRFEDHRPREEYRMTVDCGGGDDDMAVNRKAYSFTHESSTGSNMAPYPGVGRLGVSERACRGM